jgi:PKHD-type hydroxylase
MIKLGPLYNKPFEYEVLEDFLKEDNIQFIFNNLRNVQFEDTDKINLTYKNTETNEEDNFRRTRIKWLAFNDIWRGLYGDVLEQVHRSNSNLWKFDLKQLRERFQYTEYHASENGHYDWHVDVGNDDATSYRKISVTIQLSHPDEYEGGDLQIFESSDDFISEREDKSQIPYRVVDRGLGTMAIFPSYVVHRVTPVTKGVRKSLVLWVGGKPFK